MINDPIVEEVRAIRERLAAEHDYDLKKIFASFRKTQEQYADRLIRLPKVTKDLTPVSPGPSQALGN